MKSILSYLRAAQETGPPENNSACRKIFCDVFSLAQSQRTANKILLAKIPEINIM